MKFGYMQNARENGDLPVTVAEKNISSAKITAAIICQPTEQVRIETGLVEAVSQRLHLNLV